MKISVDYDKETSLREKIWGISKHFSGEKFVNVVKVPVHLPKVAKSQLEIVSETLSGLDPNSDEACERMMGMTAPQFQQKYGRAWND